MADFQYMIIGVTKAETGSMDAYFFNQIIADQYDYAYLGCPTGSGIIPTWFTWNTGSLSNTNQKDNQMYTPYPTATQRGKLYWVGTGSFEANYSGIPNNECPTNGSVEAYCACSSPLLDWHFHPRVSAQDRNLLN
jgi:hypothetical protein